MHSVQLRCPVGPKRLLAIVRSSGDTPKVVPGNLVEFACYDCKTRLRKEGEKVVQVLHRYNLAGELVESEALYEDSK